MFVGRGDWQGAGPPNLPDSLEVSVLSRSLLGRRQPASQPRQAAALLVSSGFDEGRPEIKSRLVLPLESFDMQKPSYRSLGFFRTSTTVPAVPA